MKIKLQLGDPSNDGHGQTEDVILESNKTTKEVFEAYKASCRLTGVSFNHNDDFTGIKRSWEESDNFRIATEYEESTIPQKAFDILDAFEGFPFKGEDCSDCWLDVDNFVNLWIWFVKLSLPDWEVSIIEDDIPVINRVQFGYGLFS